jgi:transketolase
MTLKDAMIIGCSQVFALIPGFSRSGTTIAAGRCLNLKREDAAKFSFFLSAPVVLGAVILDLKDSIGAVLDNFAIFAVGRAFEQVRNSIAYPNLNVKIAATHAGVTVGEDGATHQAIEDIALMRAVPNMNIICPADQYQTAWAIEEAIKIKGPVYIRLGRCDVPDIYNENSIFEFGKGNELRKGKDVTIIATGLMVSKALEASEMLNEKGISARVIDIHTIKPLDTEIIIKAAKETRGIIVAEEHNIIGGLGGAVAEIVSENCPTKVLRVGIEDEFGQSGKATELLVEYGLTSEKIVEKSQEILKY